MNPEEWDRLTTVFVNRRRNWNGTIDYSYIYSGFHQKEPYHLEVDELDQYWYVNRNRRRNSYVHTTSEQDIEKIKRIMA